MYTFKLKAVLEYRRQIEDARQQEFAAVMQVWEREREKLEHYHKSWRACLLEWRSMQEKSVSIASVDMYQKYMLRLRHEINGQAERVKKCVAEVDEKRNILLQAQKERKMMETLEESELLHYRKELADRERKYYDEIATQRFNRKGSPR